MRQKACVKVRFFVVPPRRDDVRFVGLLASFRNIDNAVWRGVSPVPPNKTTAVTGMLDELTLSLSAATAPCLREVALPKKGIDRPATAE